MSREAQRLGAMARGIGPTVELTDSVEVPRLAKPIDGTKLGPQILNIHTRCDNYRAEYHALTKTESIASVQENA